jgi:sulfate/thiosulfate transport system substrate-binding protein
MFVLMRRSLRAPTLASLAMLAAALLLAACGSSSSSSSSSSSGGGSAKLSLVAYSTPKEAYAAIVPAFQRTAAGKGVTFDQSYGASGDQSRAVASGLSADVVAFSLSSDVNRLVKSGQVAADWNAGPDKGNVTNSVVVFVVRKGNPKHITGWDDLTRKGVDVITPNPISSGGARWNIMAAYGAQIRQGKTPQQALQYLKALFANVSVQDKSARDALNTFTQGKGDVLISYENDAITAKQKGQAVDYVIPKQTILIENPAAVTKSSKHPQQARAFLAFLRTPEAQRIYASKGYRPVTRSLVDAKAYPTPPVLFTIKDFGGWSAVTPKFFDPSTGLVTKIEQARGVSTASG